MALDLPLPRNVLTHGHWTMNREKMSKSIGNVVNPFFAIDRFGVDTMRFFLAYQGALAGDADYDNEYIIRDYKKMLQWGIGNLAHRTMGCAKWNLRPYVAAAAAGELPQATPLDEEHQSMLEQSPIKVAEHMENLNPRAALREIMTIIEKVCKSNHAVCWIFSTNAFCNRPTSISTRRNHGALQQSLNVLFTMSANPCEFQESCYNHSCPENLLNF